MSNELKVLLERFGDEQKVCLCGKAYLTPSIDNSAGSCNDGRCEWHRASSLEEVLPKVLNALSLLNPEDASRLDWLTRQVDAQLDRVADKPNDVYRLNVIHRAMTTAGVLPAGQTPSPAELHVWGAELERIAISDLLARRMICVKRDTSSTQFKQPNLADQWEYRLSAPKESTSL